MRHLIQLTTDQCMLLRACTRMIIRCLACGTNKRTALAPLVPHHFTSIPRTPQSHQLLVHNNSSIITDTVMDSELVVDSLCLFSHLIPICQYIYFVSDGSEKVCLFCTPHAHAHTHSLASYLHTDTHTHVLYFTQCEMQAILACSHLSRHTQTHVHLYALTTHL